MCFTGFPPSGDLFALGTKATQRQSNSPTPLPPAKKPHIDDSDDAGSSGSNVLFSDPIKIAQGQSKAPVGSSETVSSTSKLATLSSNQAIEGVVMALASHNHVCNLIIGNFVDLYFNYV